MRSRVCGTLERCRKQPPCRTRFSGVRTRSGTRDAISAFGRTAGDGTRLDVINDSADGAARTAHSYKDKLARGMSANVGLFSYPDSDGGGYSNLRQRCRAGRQGPETTHRNHARSRGENERNYGEIFKLPEPRIQPATETVPGIDDRK